MSMDRTEPAVVTRLAEQFPFVAQSSPETARQLAEHAVLKQLPAGSPVFWEGDRCTHLALILSGTVRVYKLGESGRELTLYRIEAQESCILTASCILSASPFPAIAAAETDVEAVLVPAAILREWVAVDAGWRDYVFGLLAQRLSFVIATVEEVAFRRVDERLAEFLLARMDDQGEVTMTHQEIAVELGTAREVVSRILKDWERTGAVQLARGHVHVVSAAALQAVGSA